MKGAVSNMFVNLDFESKKPIYIQLQEQLIAGIAKKDIQPGELLPSVRRLASDIGINLHTVRKAYQHLELDGYIVIHRQKGVVVNPDRTVPADETYLKELKVTLDPLIASSICKDLDKKAFLHICEDIYDRYQRKEDESI